MFRKYHCLLVAFVLTTLSLAIAAGASAATMSKRLPSDIPGVELLISCDTGPLAADYSAETGSGAPLTDPYAVARGANKGLVRLMNEGGKRTPRYIVPHGMIRALVRMKYDMDSLDKLDLLFTPAQVTMIHTFAANAGIFVESDVYELVYDKTGGVDRAPLGGDAQLSYLLNIGLSCDHSVTGD